jgi:uncharacterized membrane protein
MNPRIRALTVLVAVFLVGGALGGTLYHLWSPTTSATTETAPPRPAGERDRRPPRLDQMLQLSPEQDTRFKEIMTDARRQFDASRKEQDDRFEAIRADMNTKILAILNHQQKEKFQAFLKDVESKRPRHRPPEPPAMH